MEEELVIGIDLGTTFSVGCFYNSNATSKFTDFNDSNGSPLVPSSVFFRTNDVPAIGAAAIIESRKRGALPNLIYDAKRMIGRAWADNTFQDFKRHWEFDVEQGDPLPSPKNDNVGHDIKIKVKDGSLYKPHEISALVLAQVKAIGEKCFGNKVIKKAVITVPAYFKDAERRATQVAAQIAGIEVLRIINEPTAAAIAYAVDQKINEGQQKNILVFDLGGGTFDVTVLKFSKTDGNIDCEVLATEGDSALGGRDIENNMMDYIEKQCIEKRKVERNLKEDQPKLYQKLRRLLEQYKKDLSSAPNVSIELDEIDFEVVLTREVFERINSNIWSKCETILKQLFERGKCRFTLNDIEDVILVGGSTYIPKVEEIVTNFTRKVPQKKINPDLVVARGAAVFAASLIGKCDIPFTVFDICSHNIGVEVQGAEMSPIIKRESTLPDIKSGEYTTASYGQKSIAVKIFEGNNPLTKDNTLLNNFTLTGYPVNNNEKVPFTISLSVSADGVINATVKCMTHNWNEKLHCVTSSRGVISDKDIAESTTRIQELLKGNTNTNTNTNKSTTNIVLGNGNTNISERTHVTKFSKVLSKVEELENRDKMKVQQIRNWFDVNKNTCSENEIKEKLQELKECAREWGDYVLRTYYN